MCCQAPRNLTQVCCSSKLLATRILSRYTKTKESPRNTQLVKRWKVWAAPLRPKGMCKNLKRLNWVIMVVLGTSSARTGTWWYPCTKSILEKIDEKSPRETSQKNSQCAEWDNNCFPWHYLDGKNSYKACTDRQIWVPRLMGKSRDYSNTAQFSVAP